MAKDFDEITSVINVSQLVRVLQFQAEQRRWRLAIIALLHARVDQLCVEQTEAVLVDFDYTDTSGELQNQTTKHQALLQAFVASVRQDLAKSEKYRVVSLACEPEPCSIARSDPSKLLSEARSAGATLLLYGGIHKESTLVQWAKVQVVDVQTDKLVFDRLLSFRGDDDTAWQRAEAFLVEDLKARDLSE
jgi:hypothetical protein